MRRPIHIRRVKLSIQIANPTPPLPADIPGQAVLNDLSPSGIGLCVAYPMAEGQELTITLEEPQKLALHGKVVWCREHRVGSHVLSDTAYSYKLGVKFVFKSAEEEEQVRKFFQELLLPFLYGKKAA